MGLRFCLRTDSRNRRRRVMLAARSKSPRVDVFPYLAAADLVKIDIEGSEWEILADARFAGIAARVLVLEYHPQGSSEMIFVRPPTKRSPA